MVIEHQLGFWDFGGQDRFSFVLPKYMKGTNLLIYSIDALDLNKSINYIKNEGYGLKSLLSPVPELYVKAKCDLIESQEEMTPEEIDNEIACAFPGKVIIPVSSKTGEGIDSLLYVMLNALSMYHNIQNCSETKTINSKIAVIGSGGSGKTCLLERIITGEFNSETKLTVGVNYKFFKITQTE